MEKMFIKKEKWSIKFVPYTEGECGVAIKFTGSKRKVPGGFRVGLTFEEFEEFGFDLVNAMLHRYDVEFPNDIKPKKPREQLAKEMIAIASKREGKQQYIV